MFRSCIAENGMEFDESQINDLSTALYEDAVKPGKDGISVDDLSDQFRKDIGSRGLPVATLLCHLC